MRVIGGFFCAAMICGLVTFNFAAAEGNPAVSEYFGADLDEDTRKDLAAKIKEITSDPDKRDFYMEEVRHRTVLCKTCHGEDGKAIKPLTPNLAGQNTDYMIDQMRRFKNKDRFDYWMSNLAIGFTEEDMIKISLYYSGMKDVVSGGGTPELKERGGSIYRDICQECHGDVEHADRLHQATFYMGFCIDCHQVKDASLECTACHQ